MRESVSAGVSSSSYILLITEPSALNPFQKQTALLIPQVESSFQSFDRSKTILDERRKRGVKGGGEGSRPGLDPFGDTRAPLDAFGCDRIGGLKETAPLQLVGEELSELQPEGAVRGSVARRLARSRRGEKGLVKEGKDGKRPAKWRPGRID